MTGARRAGVALAGLFSCLAAVAGSVAAELERGFSTPPMEARPRCWWHWMDRNISKEGITKDLEAMASVGIGGATILDVACFGVEDDDNRVKGPVRTLSPEWFDCVQHALAEAHRLGLTLSVANCPGWSSSGGPWIRPEHAMKNLGCTTVTVEGGRHLSLKLVQCHLEKGWGKDVAVLACPAAPGDGFAFMDDVVRITVLHDPDLKLPKPAEDYIHFTTDGNVLRNPKWTEQILFNPRLSKKPQGLVFELRRPIRMCGVEVTLSGPPWGNKAKYRISVSGDGRAWTEHVTTDFIVKGGGVAAFPPVTSRFFKLEPLECDWLPVMGVDFTPAMRIPRLKEKAYYVHDTFDKFPTFAHETKDCPPEFAIDPARTVDVTEHMKSDGAFEWDAPAGRWTICRFTTYARQSGNHPANPEGRGLECDKLSAAGVDEVWRGMMAPIAAAAKKAGTGEALRYTLVDSYEVGPQNWTDDMVAQFKARRGYDPTPYLPVMTGRYVRDSETSERFLEDVRRTVSDLFADVYGDYFRRKANKDGILLEIEPYGGPFDELRQGRSADIPMGEFWAGPTWGVGNAKLASNVADVNGRRYVQTETFTAGWRNAAWTSLPAHHKKQGDFAFCEGVNRFVFHSYAHQSFETTGPGMTMGCWGFMFNRHNTLWPYYGGWLSYVGRAQFMLQQGRSVGDVLYVVKEDTPCTPDWRPETPFGYRANAVDAEMFLRDARTDGAELALPCGQRYRVLVLPRTDVVSPAILEKAAACARSGVQVLLGPRPLRSFGLRDAAAADARVKVLADALWNGLDERTKSKPMGKGCVWLGARVADLLAAASVRPDFESVDRKTCPSAVTEPSKIRVNFTHRTLPDREVYFVANVGEGPVAFTGRFRAQGAVELWDAEKGTHAAAPVWSARPDGMTDVDLSLSNAESVFVVFRRDVRPAAHVACGRAVVSRETAAEDVSGDWTAKFETSRGGPAHEVPFAKLASLSESSDPAIRYYSGTVTYRRTIDVPHAWSDGQVFLDLGEVCDASRVFVNGKEVGTTWHAPHRVELTGMLKAGANELVVKVGNRWINRLIGDEEAPLPVGDRWVDKGEIQLLSSPTLPAVLLEGKQPEGRFAYGTCRPYKKGEKLRPAGLIGPVRLTLWTNQGKNEDK